MSSLYQNLQAFEQRKKDQAAAGRATSSLSLLAYTPEMERRIAGLPSNGAHRVDLQDPVTGRFNFKVNDDGTRTAGSFYIDSFGRFISY